MRKIIMSLLLIVAISCIGSKSVSNPEAEKAAVKAAKSFLALVDTEKYPESWNIKDSLGEAYKTLGDNKNAKKYYEAALKMAPDNQKDRIKKILADL